MNLSLFIARRYLFSKKKNGAINIISWISVAAIAVGTGALIIVLSGMNGLTTLVQGLYSSFDADLEITPSQGKIIRYTQEEIDKLRELEGIGFVCPVIEDNVLLKYNDRISVARIKGVPGDYVTMTRLDTLIREGSFKVKDERGLYMVLGQGLAYRLGINLNSYFTAITAYSPIRGKAATLNPEENFNEERFYPAGTFSINDDFDFTYVLSDLERTRNLIGYDKNECTAIELSVLKNQDEKKLREKLTEILGNNINIKNKFQQNQILFKTLSSEKLWTFIILAFILLVATFNIIGALSMLIIEKKKDIKILSQLGAGIPLIRNIFMIEGFLITVSGAVIGLIIGLILVVLQKKYGFVSFDEGFIISAYPVEIQYPDFIYILGTVLLIGFFAAIYPIRLFTGKSLKQELYH